MEVQANPEVQPEIQKFCRMCMCRKTEMKNIFDEKRTIVTRIQFCTGQEILDLNNLPSKICDKCLENLFTSWMFKNTCRKAEQFLKTLISEHDIQKIITNISNFGELQAKDNLYQYLFFKKEVNLKKSNDKDDDRIKFETADVSNNFFEDTDQKIECDNVEYIDEGKDFEVCIKTEYLVEDFHEDDVDLVAQKDSLKDCQETEVKELDLPVAVVLKSENEELKINLIETDIHEDFRVKQKRKPPSKGPTVKQYQCETCLKWFSSNLTLRYHIRQAHDREARYRCMHCEKGFLFRCDYRRHLESHAKLSRKKKFQCPHCPKSLHTRATLRQHTLRYHAEKPPAHACDVCGKRFLFQYDLNKHLDVHERQREKEQQHLQQLESLLDADPYVTLPKKLEPVQNPRQIPSKPCACGLTFKTKEERAYHYRTTHKPTKVCEICGETFKNPAHLFIHLPPTFACDHCEYKSCRKADLVRHIATHSGTKQYQCERCPASFYTSSNLLRHFDVHHNENRATYSCEHCGRRFLTKPACAKHVDQVHRGITDKRYECDICSSRFSCRQHWRRHLHKQHGVDVPIARGGRRAHPLRVQPHQIDLPRRGRGGGGKGEGARGGGTNVPNMSETWLEEKLDDDE